MKSEKADKPPVQFSVAPLLTCLLYLIAFLQRTSILPSFHLLWSTCPALFPSLAKESKEDAYPFPPGKGWRQSSVSFQSYCWKLSSSVFLWQRCFPPACIKPFKENATINNTWFGLFAFHFVHDFSPTKKQRLGSQAGEKKNFASYRFLFGVMLLFWDCCIISVDERDTSLEMQGNG